MRSGFFDLVWRMLDSENPARAKVGQAFRNAS